jgi:hypothetical protein
MIITLFRNPQKVDQTPPKRIFNNIFFGKKNLQNQSTTIIIYGGFVGDK